MVKMYLEVGYPLARVSSEAGVEVSASGHARPPCATAARLDELSNTSTNFAFAMYAQLTWFAHRPDNVH